MGYKVGMAWNETSVMSERIKMISEYLSGDYAISELAGAYGVSRKTVYKWISRHAAGGWLALADQSRAPRFHPNAVAAEIEQLLLALKARRPLWGAPKLRQKLLEAVGAERCPAEEHGERDITAARFESGGPTTSSGGAQPDAL
jgi:transposase-like protein